MCWCFLHSVSIHKSPSQPLTKKYFDVGKNDPKVPLLNLTFSSVGLGWGVRLFHSIICMISNPNRILVNRKPPVGWMVGWPVFRFGLVWFGLVWFGLVRFGLV